MPQLYTEGRATLSSALGPSSSELPAPQAPQQCLGVSVDSRVASGHRQVAFWLKTIVALGVSKALCKCLVDRFHSDPTRGRRGNKGQWSTSPHPNKTDRIWQSLQAPRGTAGAARPESGQMHTAGLPG